MPYGQGLKTRRLQGGRGEKNKCGTDYIAKVLYPGVNKSEVDLPHRTSMVTVFPLAQVAVNATQHIHTGSLVCARPPVVIALDRLTRQGTVKFDRNQLSKF